MALPAAILAVALLAAGCGRADDRAPPGPSDAAPAPAATPQPAAAPPSTLNATEALCVAAPTGSIKARLQGAIDTDLDWGADASHCLGGLRPQGDGVRLIYKGSAPGVGPLLVVLGIAPLKPGESARNVPVNLTVVREGTGQFFATQGDDKCTLDSVSQAPVAGEAGRYRLEGRGFCTQPARAVGGDGAVLLTRFDVVAIVQGAR
jgi:hypothetical protein